MTAVFDMYSAYYDLLYRDKNYQAEAEHIHRLIQRHRPGAGTILELGSGTGRHARLLAEMGYRVHGIERSASMLETARAHAAESACREQLSFEQKDIRNLGESGRFDVVISLFHVVSYLTSNRDLQAVFASVAKNLQPEGIFLFDCWYGPAVLHQVPDVRVKRVENDAYRLVRIAEPSMLRRENVVKVNYDMFIEQKSDGRILHFSEVHPMRYFFEPELELLLAGAGQKIVFRGADLGTDLSPSEEHWGLTVVSSQPGLGK
jgi:SAM-dependent methyltransferase